VIAYVGGEARRGDVTAHRTQLASGMIREETAMADDARREVVLHFRDGHTTRCTLPEEVEPSGDGVFEALTSEGEPLEVPYSRLKAIFFLKGARQRAVEMQMGERIDIPQGTALARVEFFDGEIIRGRIKDYAVSNRGFYIYPVAVESNNDRVFVLASALTTLAIEE